MNKKINIEQSSGNVYADLGNESADEMLAKAQLTAKIGETIKSRKLSQQEAAKLLGMTLPDLLDMLRGKFSDISQAKLLSRLSGLYGK